MTDLSFSIVGAGRVGVCLGVLLQRAGYELAGCTVRSDESERRASRWLDCPIFHYPDGADAAAVIIAVPDDAVSEVCDSLKTGEFVMHTAGALGVTALSSAVERGAQVLAFHILQSIPDVEIGIERIPGSWFGITCEDDLRPWAEKLATDLGGKPLWVPEDERVVYHAAAVIASNYLVTIAGLAEEAFGQLEPYLPLMRGTIDNLERLGPQRALTGPIVRGDVGTIKRHLEALSPPIRETYEALATATRRLAAR